MDEFIARGMAARKPGTAFMFRAAFPGNTKLLILSSLSANT
jgi:hypothetical protein